MMKEKTTPDPLPPTATGSLRGRLFRWSVLVLAPTVFLLTAAAIWEERREVLRQEKEQAGALLQHLARMDEFRGTLAAARSRLESVNDLLRATGAQIELVPRPPSRRMKGLRSPPELSGDILATQPISLVEGDFALQYRADPRRFQTIAVRSATTHVVYGVLALVALIGGAQWILRRKLLLPLSRIAHRVDDMRKGGGWLPVLPPTDSELAGLVRSLRELGPGLESQVLEWVEVERRAVAATLLNDLDRSLSEPRRQMMALAGDLQARGCVSPEGKAKLRALNSEVDHVVEVLRLAESARFGRRNPAVGGSSEENVR
jgi:hypothetical protein